MNISVIIPTLNEKEQIVKVVNHLKEHSNGQIKEIIVVDGGSTDGTIERAKELDINLIESKVRRRSLQMNEGAAKAKGEVLYFVHADSLPPKKFDKKIINSVTADYKSGCFRSKFDSDNAFLQFCSYCTRYRPIICRGGGQTLFVEKELFKKVGRYKDEQIVMEEYDLIKRLKMYSKFKIIPDNVIVSARKYRKNGTYRLYLSYASIFILFFLGVNQKRLRAIYHRLIR